MKNEIEISDNLFEKIKHIDENGNEYWSARELYKILEYTEYGKFKPIIEKAIISCVNSGNNAVNHFAHVSEMIETGKTAHRKVDNYRLTRYACYLIAQNADSRKKTVALAQTYFATQTRKMEILEEEYEKLSEDDKRLYRRKQTRDGNKFLYITAKKAGVKNFDKFTNAGYKGLYGGLTADDIAKRKGIRYREEILDNMSSEELGANIFRITQTEAKLKRDNVDNEYTANSTHFEVGKKVRDTIKELGGTMPEDLPTPNKSIKELEKDNQSKIKNK